MSNLIKTIDEGLAEVRSVLQQYLSVVKDKNVGNLDLNGLIMEFQSLFPRLYHERTAQENLDIELSYFIRNIGNLKRHEKEARMTLINDPYFIASSLEIVRLFIEPLIEQINQTTRDSFGGYIFDLPEFLHAINQPDGSRFKPDPVIDWKTKSFDYVTTRRAPFDLSTEKEIITRHSAKKILTEQKYFKNGTKILLVRTVGHIFLFDRYGNGHTGDWEDPGELGDGIDKIVIVHFFEGKDSSKAHIYVGDVYNREYKNFYTTPRYRYCFSNLLWCGEVKADFVDDFHSILFFDIEYEP